MSKQPRFWRNVALIALAHVALVAGLLRWNQEKKNSASQSVVWINSSSGGGPAPETNYGSVPTPARAWTPPPEPSAPKPAETEEDRPVLTSAKSDIQLPATTPSATPTAKPSATPVVKVPPPKPTPKPRKPTPKPSPKPTPKPSPKKTLLAKASPKPSPKLKPTPEPAEENDEEVEAEAEKKKIAKAALARNETNETEGDSIDKPVRKAIAAHNGSGNGTSGDANDHGDGTGGASEFGWYGAMLHDRFYSEWIQPTTSVSSTSKISALVKLRIEKDGRVSSFEIIKPSGNVMIDESVATIAKRVRQVDPLPAGLGKGGHYDVKINFELNSEQ